MLINQFDKKIDDIRGKARPVHSTLLGGDIPICEHLTSLALIPLNRKIYFSAVPAPVKSFGTFPVRAHVIVEKSSSSTSSGIIQSRL